MTDDPTPPELGNAAQARRIYHHVLNGGHATARDIGRMVEIIETLETDLIGVHKILSDARQSLIRDGLEKQYLRALGIHDGLERAARYIETAGGTAGPLLARDIRRLKP